MLRSEDTNGDSELTGEVTHHGGRDKSTFLQRRVGYDQILENLIWNGPGVRRTRIARCQRDCGVATAREYKGLGA